jgi:hypothetical protein
MAGRGLVAVVMRRWAPKIALSCQPAADLASPKPTTMVKKNAADDNEAAPD